MKYFIFSDVHGFYSILKEELNKSGFDENDSNHMLISLGDNFDRGKENYQMFKFLKDMKSKNKIILIKGNHEDLFIKMMSRGYASNVDKHNGTYDTLNEFYHHYFNDYTTDIKDYNFDSTYYELKNDGFFDLIYGMKNYYETDHYIFTHGFIPVNIDGQYYGGINNATYKKNWRNATEQEFQDSRWLNGIQMSMQYKIGEPNKKIVVGHFHASYGNIRKKMKKGLPNSIYSKYEFFELENFKPYIDKRVIAIDACTVYTKQINVFVVED